MLALYHNDMSFCAQKVRVCLAEKGLAWQDRHLQQPDVQEKLKKFGFDSIVKTQKDAAAYFKSEMETWGKMARTVGVSVD